VRGFGFGWKESRCDRKLAGSGRSDAMASRRPSAAWYLLPVAILAVAVVAVVLMKPGRGLLDSVLGAREVRMPGETEVDLEEPGSYMIYRLANDAGMVPMDFTVTRADTSEVVPLSAVGVQTTLSRGQTFTAVKRFHLETPGVVRLKGAWVEGYEGRPQAVMIGPSLDPKGIFRGVFGILASVGIGILGLALAGAAFVLIILKRGQRKLLPTPPQATPPPQAPPPETPPSA
jgi:hypothetical protein